MPFPFLRDAPRPLAAAALRLVIMRFLVYVGIQACYFIGVLGTLTYTMGADVLDTALSVALLNGFIMLGSFAGGSALDAWGPRRHFAVAAAGLGAVSLYYLVAADTPVTVLMGAALLGLAVGFADVIARSYPAYLTDDPRVLKRINGAISASSNIGVVVGPLVGGAIALVAPTTDVFLFLLACSLASLVPAAGFHPLRTPAVEAPAPQGDEGEESAASARRGTSLKDGVAAVMSSTPLTLLFWIGFLCFLGYGAFDPLESLFYRDVLQVGVSWMGWLSAAAGAGAIVGALLVMRFPGRLVSLRTLLIVQIAEGVGCLVYVGTPWVGVALVGQLVLGVAFGAFTPLQNTLVQTHAPLDVVGRVSSIMNFGFNAAGVLPLLAAPWLAQVMGVQGALLLSSAVVTVMPALILVLKRRDLARIDRRRDAAGA